MRYIAVKVGLLLLATFVVVAMFGWDLLKDMDKLQAESKVMDKSNRQSHDLHDIEMGVFSNIKLVKDFLIMRNNALESQFIHAHTNILETISQYEKNYADTSLAELTQSITDMKGKALDIFHLKFSENDMEAPILVKEMEIEMQQAISHLNNKHHDLDNLVVVAMQMVEGLRIDMRNDMMMMLLVLLGTLLFLTYFIYQHMVLPLVQMRQAVKRVGKGDFQVHCDVVSQDEIGELGKAFNAMAATLQERETTLNKARSLAAYQERMNVIGVMSAGIAHELGNPLASLAMLIQLAQRHHQQHDYNTVSKHLKTAFSETERMESIIHTILHFGKYNVEADFQDFQVKPIVDDAIRLAQMSPLHKRVPLSIEIQPHISSINGSDSMLMQVLINLIYNAFNACKSGGEINIRIFMSNKKLYIDVCDTGHGIPEHLHQEIFKPSFTTKDEGTGLGLAISQELMRSMHGSLELLSDKQEGTCFRLCLPLTSMQRNANENISR